jgi:hypothetical protein
MLCRGDVNDGVSGAADEHEAAGGMLMDRGTFNGVDLLLAGTSSLFTGVPPLSMGGVASAEVGAGRRPRSSTE